MVHREKWDTYWGPKKLISACRDTDVSAMAGASMESCRFVALGSPWSRLGSVLVTCKRLRRMRRRFHQGIQIKTGPQQHDDQHYDLPKFWIQSSRGDQNRRRRSRRPSDPRPTPERVREPICPRKKRAIWTRWHPFPSKTSITRGPPVVAVAVSLDPILPHR